MGFLGELGGKRIFPYSPKAQRSAQPVGIQAKILSECIRIVIVA